MSENTESVSNKALEDEMNLETLDVEVLYQMVKPSPSTYQLMVKDSKRMVTLLRELNNIFWK